jgi:hypothetical protein
VGVPLGWDGIPNGVSASTSSAQLITTEECEFHWNARAGRPSYDPCELSRVPPLNIQRGPHPLSSRGVSKRRALSARVSSIERLAEATGCGGWAEGGGRGLARVREGVGESDGEE